MARTEAFSELIEELNVLLQNQREGRRFRPFLKLKTTKQSAQREKIKNFGMHKLISSKLTVPRIKTKNFDRLLENAITNHIKTQLSSEPSFVSIGYKRFEKAEIAYRTYGRTVHIDEVLKEFWDAFNSKTSIAIEQEDSHEFIDAAEFMERCQISEETLSTWLKNDHVFTISTTVSQRYPAFQLNTGVFGEALQAVLKVLHHLDGATRYQFFTTPNQLLEGLSPLQLLSTDPLSALANLESESRLLTLPANERLYAVCKAAGTYREIIES